MFRTGHRTDPAPPAEPMAEPTRMEPKAAEHKAAETLGIAEEAGELV